MKKYIYTSVHVQPEYTSKGLHLHTHTHIYKYRQIAYGYIDQICITHTQRVIVPFPHNKTLRYIKEKRKRVYKKHIYKDLAVLPGLHKTNSRTTIFCMKCIWFYYHHHHQHSLSLIISVYRKNKPLQYFQFYFILKPFPPSAKQTHQLHLFVFCFYIVIAPITIISLCVCVTMCAEKCVTHSDRAPAPHNPFDLQRHQHRTTPKPPTTSDDLHEPSSSSEDDDDRRPSSLLPRTTLRSFAEMPIGSAEQMGNAILGLGFYVACLTLVYCFLFNV